MNANPTRSREKEKEKEKEMIYAYLRRKYYCGDNYILKIKQEKEDGLEIEVTRVYQLHRKMDPIEMDIEETNTGKRRKMYIQKNRQTDFYNIDENYDRLAIYREIGDMTSRLIVIEQGICSFQCVLK